MWRWRSVRAALGAWSLFGLSPLRLRLDFLAKIGYFGGNFMEFHRLQPGRQYYLMAVVILAAGAVFFTWNLRTGLDRLTSSMQRVVVPGSQVVRFDEPDHYVMFYEFKSRIGRKDYNTGPRLSGLICELNEASTEAYVPLMLSTEHIEYSAEPYAGVSVFEFDIEKPGTYILTSFYAEGESGRKIVMAVASDFRRRLRKVTRPSLFVMVGSIFFALIITFIVFGKRHRAKEARLEREAALTLD